MKQGKTYTTALALREGKDGNKKVILITTKFEFGATFYSSSLSNWEWLFELHLASLSRLNTVLSKEEP